jgi:asparagine synthase (glutamine-hydrolysing)
MCGIAGIITGKPREGMQELCRVMAQSLAHRGPDGEGFWDDGERVYMAHRRLSIIDPTPASDQPLIYGQYVLLFNGEIYNYRELKHELQQSGYRFVSNGDSEVVPAAFDKWGIDCLQRFDGMFALALFDTNSKKLWLVRDRFGEKPLYFHARYAALGRLDYLIFGSEMKALWAAGAPREPNPMMMINYLSHGFVQNPIVKTDTFFKEILSLPPGYLLEVDTIKFRFSMRRWYEPFKLIGHLSAEEAQQEDAVMEKLHDLFLHAVRTRLRSDVPVGTSLSGGLDSSSIVAAIDAIKRKDGSAEGWCNVCFSAIFPGYGKDEDVWSKQVAENFGVRRFVVKPTEQDLLQYWESLMYHQEEPVQSSSVLAQYMVYREAKEEAVSVLLDGQGADEILGGYAKYSHWFLQQLLRKSRGEMQKEKILLQENGMLEQWGLSNYVAAWLPHQTAKFLKLRTIRQQNSFPFEPAFYDAYKDHHTLFKPEVRTLEDILYFNTFNFGLEELLRYADRNSMAHSREVRLPFLQHELVHYIFSLPAHFKIRQGFGKWILRKTMARYLPKELVWRKGKVGFEPPQQSWMLHASIKEMVMESRGKLVESKIIKPSELERPLYAGDAHRQENKDFRYLSLASILI